MAALSGHNLVPCVSPTDSHRAIWAPDDSPSVRRHGCVRCKCRIHAALVKPHVEEAGPLVGAATDREELDPLGVFTTGAELIGALGAAVLIRMKETA